MALALLFIGVWYYRLPYYKKFGPHVVMVYQAKHRPEVVAPNGKHVEYVVISIVKGNLVVELITGPGLHNVKRLEGAEAVRFLEHHKMTVYGG